MRKAKFLSLACYLFLNPLHYLSFFHHPIEKLKVFFKH
ncbi:hypothetical protein AWRI1631_130690 [Saccharomyces cerevisiae AWRI1631]|uniref:Uncharacterized protein n=1 Tax=Saccharomyces cerevisiae (strain AWRI1631) TaxID=545124 RepID=B5VP63_YEAS6|nr:hypothetical protein AWRI1631_130690 [Saccharomyces cerevisiae AWRI1631]